MIKSHTEPHPDVTYFNLVGWRVNEGVRVATTEDGNFETDYCSGQIVDDVVLATGDRILIKDLTSRINRGVYLVNETGAPTRAPDFLSFDTVEPATTVHVAEGSKNQDHRFATNGLVYWYTLEEYTKQFGRVVSAS